jgi:hypothetical protein
MKKRFPFSIVFIMVFMSVPVFLKGQQTVAEKLGYPANTRLLIVHADDIGLAQSVNDATLTAFQAGWDHFGEHHGSLSLVR